MDNVWPYIQNLRHYLGMAIGLLEEIHDDLLEPEDEEKVLDFLKRVKSGTDVRAEDAHGVVV